MSISASMVKTLRERTGAGMMDCKQALEETNGDMEKAIDWLRQRGLSKASKKVGQATTEGLIGCEVLPGSTSAILVEVMCETDFVSRDGVFKKFVDNIVSQLVTNFHSDNSELLDQPFTGDKSLTIRDLLNQAIATIGENIVIGRSVQMELTPGRNGMIGHYVHTNGKIAVLVEMATETKEVASSSKFQELAKNIAMQIAATAPLALDAESIDPLNIDREREVYRQKAQEEGKPEAMIEKIVEGAVKKYLKEVCLLEQPYIRDDKLSIAELIKKVSAELGEPLYILEFVRIQLGEE